MTDFIVTSGSAWRKTHIAQLPSGNVAELKKPDVLDLIQNEDGTIPDMLLQFVTGVKQVKNVEMTGETGKLFIDLIQKLTKASFVSPRVVDNPSADNEIALGDVELADKLFVLRWAMGNFAEETKSPSPEQIRAMASRLNS
jgi:hypothetical protein